MSLPRGIQFKNVKPQGFYQEYRDYYVTPVQTYTNQFNTNDIIRIQFRIDDWYIDPYESYIEAEVRLKDETAVNFGTAYDPTVSNPIQLLMMDGPSTSLINDFRLEVNSVEVERTREYDQLGNLLTDLNLYPDAVDQKDYEGYYTIKGLKTIETVNTQNNLLTNPAQGTTPSNYAITQVEESCPVFAQRYSSLSAAGEPMMGYYGSVNVAPLGIATNKINLNNIFSSYYDNSAPVAYTGPRSSTSGTGLLVSLADDTRITGGAQVLGQVYNYSQYLGQITAANSNYGINHTNYIYGSGAASSACSYIPVVQSPKLAQIDGHNTILTNMPTAKIINGKFQASIYNQSATTCSSRAYMQIPLLSGVMGVLIPSDRWQLIPSNSLGQVNMEFRFNDNAFFSHNGSQPQWLVTKFQLRLRMYRFDSALQSQLKAQVSSGIQMHSQNFSMGPIYSIQPNVSVTNNWQLNNGIPSVKQLFFWFLSNDYETYWHARKNFKVSQNVTSMQLKIGSGYIPQQPILGHSGNVVMNSVIPVDNSVFLSELHQALNVLFDCKKHTNINKLNFAVNERPYDVTLQTFLGGFPLAGGRAKMMIEGGYSMWNEQRCRGKAVYAFNLEADKTNDSTMSGLDTRKTRPIELILKSDDPNTYPRLSTMYVMFLNDLIVTFNDGNLTTEGQG